MYAALSSLMSELGSSQAAHMTLVEAMAKFPGFAGTAHVAGHGVTVTPSPCCSCHFEDRTSRISTGLVRQRVFQTPRKSSTH